MKELQANRVALLALDTTDPGITSGRRDVGGVSCLERQIDVALAMGCGRIILYAPLQDTFALRAQHLAENSGAQFRVIQRGRQLLGALKQQDELLVLAEGFLVADLEGLEPLRSGPVLLTIPAEVGASAGFERLDRDRAWAGAMVIPGRILEKLEGLGDDIEPVSALLRAARSGRVPELAIPESWLTENRYSLTSDVAPRAESSGLEHAVRSTLKRLAIDPAAGRMVGKPRSGWTVLGAAIGSLIGANILLGQAILAPAFALLALGIFFLRIWSRVRQLHDPKVFSGASQDWVGRWAPIWPDVLGALGLAFALHIQFGLISGFYVALVIVALWHLARIGSSGWSAFFEDRETLWLGFAGAAASGQWLIVVCVFTCLALIGIFMSIRRSPAITQV